MQTIRIGSIGKKLLTLLLSATIFVSIFCGSGIQVNADDDALTAYITKYYQLVWEYEPTSDDIQYWVNNLMNDYTGADMVEEFYTSSGWTSRQVTNQEFISIAYRTILGRNPIDADISFWNSFLNNGKTYHDVIVNFVDTNEFATICNNLGIVKGTLVPPTIPDLRTEFVTRLYDGFFGRVPTQGEINAWCSEINNGKTACDIIFSFYNVALSNINALSNRDYVIFCYRAILNRTASDSDISYWAGKLSSGTTRLGLIASFTATEEFANICKSGNIPVGSITTSTVTQTDTRSLTARQRFIRQVYYAFFGREPSSSEYNNWGNALNSGTTATKFIQNLMTTSSYKSRHVSNEQFASDLYLACYGREIDEKAKSVYAEQLRTSISKYELLNKFTSTTEFKNNCKSYNVTSGYVDLTNTGNWTRLRGARALRDVESGFYVKNGWYYADGFRYYFNADGTMSQNVEPFIGPQSSYFLRVDTVANYVIIYARTYAGGAYDTPVKAMLCSCGMDATPTILGTYTLRRLDTWWPLNGGLWGQYCTQISGNYLFHSVWYYVRGDKKSITVSGFNALGYRQSHGCVRLTVSDAKWIFEHCNGCRVNTAESQPHPFDKPEPYYAVAVRGDYGYDPRDPGL